MPNPRVGIVEIHCTTLIDIESREERVRRKREREERYSEARLLQARSLTADMPVVKGKSESSAL
jgi:hypothetical protein